MNNFSLKTLSGVASVLQSVRALAQLNKSHPGSFGEFKTSSCSLPLLGNLRVVEGLNGVLPALPSHTIQDNSYKLNILAYGVKTPIKQNPNPSGTVKLAGQNITSVEIFFSTKYTKVSITASLLK